MIDFYKKLALYHAHFERCAYCNKPILFNEMTVDHIVPKTLLENPERKKQVFSDYGLPDDFNIESYNNWIPCHQWENRQKSDTLFIKSSALFYIGVASERAKDAEHIENQWRTAKRNDRLLYQLNVELRNGHLSTDQIFNVVDEYQHDVQHIESSEITEENVEVPNEPLIIAFGITIDTVVEEDLYEKDLIENYPELCDRMMVDLLYQLSAKVSCKSFVCEDLRDGEAFSIRIAFENPNPDEIFKLNIYPWEILEVGWYSEIYDIDIENS